MKLLVQALLVLALAVNVSACGTKGRLKTPAQIEAAEKKKARKANKDAGKEVAPEEEAEEAPQPAAATTPAPQPTTIETMPVLRHGGF